MYASLSLTLITHHARAAETFNLLKSAARERRVGTRRRAKTTRSLLLHVCVYVLDKEKEYMQ